MKPSEQRWPAQQAPDDFADRVVQAGLRASRANFAEIEPSVRRASSRSFRRAAGVWSLAAALAVGALVLYLGKIKSEAEARKDLVATQLIEAEEKVARQAREVVELRAAVAKLEGDLLRERHLVDRVQGNIPQKLMAQRAQTTASTAATRAAAPARPATSRPACNCQPGDALCSCL